MGDEKMSICYGQGFSVHALTINGTVYSADAIIAALAERDALRAALADAQARWTDQQNKIRALRKELGRYGN